MFSRKRILVPALAAMGLFACNRPDPVSPSGPAAGSARVALPALPAGYLAAGSAAFFRMDITGPGMSPIFVSETLYVGKPTTVEVNGIPPGQRVFHGVLYRVDSTGWDTTATHEGSASAEIRTGATANVALFLKSTAGGSAHVCLQVEGWPMDSSCVQPPPPSRYPDIAGCYALTVTKRGPMEDTLFQGRLRIDQFDSSLTAVVTWKSGAKDSATGLKFLSNDFFLGTPPSQFSFKGIADTGTGRLSGYFQDDVRGIFGNATAVPAPCDTVIPPPPVDTGYIVDTVGCWNVRQQTVDGRNMKGGLWVGWRGDALRAWFQWDGETPFAMDNGTAPAGGSTLYLFGKLPGGFAHPTRSAIETGHYKAKFGPGGTLATGVAYARAGSIDFVSTDFFADWTGSPVACPDKAYGVIAGLFR